MHTAKKVKKQTIKDQVDKEPSLPVYLAMKIHAQTRKKGLVDMMLSLGICISYPGLLRISTGLCEVSVKRIEKHKVTFPPHFRTGLFTTAAYDNLYYNPSSTTSQAVSHSMEQEFHCFSICHQNSKDQKSQV